MTRTAMTSDAKQKNTKPKEVGHEGVFNRELEDLPQELRWREWMGRIEAVLFASATPVGRDDLASVVGQGASVEMLIEDIKTELIGRPYELAQVAGGWMFRTKTQFADAIKAAADLGNQFLAFTEMEMGVLCAISAVVASARLTNHSNDIGILDELRVIAAAVIGGTALKGGIGTIHGAIIGALIMQSLQSGMAMVGVDAPLQNIVVGGVLVLAVWIDIIYRKRTGARD